MSFNHTSVLLDECVDGLNIKPDGIYVDATMGGGGHSQLIANHLVDGTLVGFDQDPVAIKHNQERFHDCDCVKIVNANFSELKISLANLGIDAIDGILYDLGMSSMQIDEQERGFSYIHDARLDMRMNPDNPIDAYNIVNTYSVDELAHIFTKYGEEKFSKRIAQRIVDQRQVSPITTTLELVAVIEQSLPKKVYYQLKSHPAKKVFQALRICVNKELEVLQSSLAQAWELLKPGGRMCVISFHSLEDKIVKQFFKQQSSVDEEIKHLPVIPEELLPAGKIITNKPILPTNEEQANNARSHSAKLRIIEKIK